MKRGWRLLLALISLAAFARPQAEPRRVTENGVEVVVNGAKPYAVAGQPRALTLREEFRIDLEDPALAAVGLTDAMSVDVDSQGRIYLFRGGGNPGRVIFRFDERGRFQKSFGTIGQGPGELNNPYFMRITARDEIPVCSQNAAGFVFLDPEGLQIRTFPIPTENPFIWNRFVLLPNGNILAQYYSRDAQDRVSKIILALFDARLRKIRDLRDFEFSGRLQPTQNPFALLPLIAVTDRAFFVNSAPSASDIAAYDLDGKLMRVIRSPLAALRIPADYKRGLLDRIPQGERYEPIRAIIRNVETWPSFQAFFADDQDRLFVEGFEKDPASGDNSCDVFSPDGVRILRTSLGRHEILRQVFERPPFDIVIKKNRGYCLREKEDGFKEVVVYTMRWI